MYSKVLNDLDFGRVIQTLSEFLITKAGKRYLKNLPLLTREERIFQEKATLQFQELINKGSNIPLYNFYDGKVVLDKIRIASNLTPAEFVKLIDFLNTYTRMYEVIFSTILAERLSHPELLKHVAGKLVRTLTQTGTVREDATERLLQLSLRKKRKEDALKRVLYLLLEEYFKKGLLREKFYTVKNNRYVFPFKAEVQKAGIVQGYSNSEKTIYIEPYEIVDLQNELIKAEDERREEEKRIIREIIELLHQNHENLLDAYKSMAYVDFIRALALFKSDYSAVFVKEKDALYVRGFRHPLLVSIKGYDKVVALDIEKFDGKGLVISGPNAGGKTVVLKSIGTISLSYLYGLPVIAEKAEIFPIKDVFTLGFTNEQDIMTGKSTFSGMIEEMKKIVEQAKEGSLVLFDEPFSLTDPQEGEVLAEAILKYLVENGARVFITTHMWGLKFFAEGHPDFLNASMLFDSETLKPLYRFKTGRMGKSHAIQMAEVIGLPDEIIIYAKKRLSTGEGKIIDLIARLEDQEALLEKKMLDFQEKEKKVMETQVKLKKYGKKLVLEEYERVQRELKELLRDLHKEKKREVKIKKVQLARKHLKEKEKEVDVFDRPATSLKLGKNYRLKPTGIVATLVSVDKKKAVVEIGKVKMEVPLTSLYEV